jgi:uncharacterized protein YbjT (DUF2867 family)
LCATQFRDLSLCLARGRFGVTLAPIGCKLQPIDVREVAGVLVAAATSAPAKRLGDVAGPDVVPFSELARAWRRAAGRRGWAVPVLALGATAAFLRSGKLCRPDRAVGTITFAAWLAERYPAC